MKFANLIKEIALQELGETTDHYNLHLKNKNLGEPVEFGSGREGRVKFMWEFATENYEYKIRMREDFSRPVLDLDFDTKEKGARVTKEGNQFKIVATVIEAAVRTWKIVREKDAGIGGFKFNPVSKASVDKDIGEVTQREKLYKAFIKKQFPNAKMERDSGGTIYVYPEPLN
jgi:hypothetical protein